MDRAKDFLEEGHKVQFTMMFRGRQMAHKDIGYRGFDDIVKDLDEVAKVEVPPRSMGRRMTMIIAPLAKGERNKAKAEKEKAEAEKAAAKKPTPPAEAPADRA
jgi:translation initiation factor IF-3